MCVLMFIDWRSGGPGGAVGESGWGEGRGEECKSSVPVTSFWSGRRSQWGNECINVGSWLWYDGQHLPSALV